MLPAYSLDNGNTWEVMYYDVSQKLPVINIVGGENEATVSGDVNGDGTVDVADIATVIDVMAGGAGEYAEDADVNGDGTVDVADIAAVIDIMAANARYGLGNIQESASND